MIKNKISKIIIVVIIVAVFGAIVYFFTSKKEKVEYIAAIVEQGRLVQTVSETGTVKASQETDLSFLNAGRVAKVLVKVGDAVKENQILAELDYSGLSIKEREAQANLDIAQAKLNKLLAGAAPEEVSVSEANVNQAKTSYSAAIRDLEKIKNKIQDDIAQAEKNLNDLKLSDPGSITIYEQAVDEAKTDLDNTKKTYQQSIDNKEASALITIEAELADGNTALDAIDNVVTDDDAKGVLSAKNLIYLTNVKISYDEGVSLLAAANISLAEAKSNKTKDSIEKALNDALIALNKIFDSLGDCFKALENTITNFSFTSADLSAFKTDISANITTISASISNTQTAGYDLSGARLTYDTKTSGAKDDLAAAEANLEDARIDSKNALSTARISGEQKIAAAEAKVDNAFEAWQVAKAELAKIKSKARSEDITLTKAQLNQAQASLDAAKNEIKNSIIKAPIVGTITAVNYEVGEQTISGSPVVSILGVNNFEIEVLISEADIAKVNKNDSAKITLDAFGDDIKFNGIVYFIEPAETVIQDVIYYKVKVEFVASPLTPLLTKEKGTDEAVVDEFSIKSGMTANVVITTDEKNNILIMPNRAVIQRNGGERYVRILVDNGIVETLVRTGMLGDGGMVEVLSGVREGDEVVTFVKKK